MAIKITSKKATDQDEKDRKEALRKVMAKYPQGVGVNWDDSRN